MAVTIEWLNLLRNDDPIRDELIDKYIAGFVNAEAARQIRQAIVAEFPDMSPGERMALLYERLAALRVPKGQA
jgi:hypothetical protein